MNSKTIIYTLFVCFFLNTALSAQFGVSHLDHNHKALVSLNYEPFIDFYPLLLRYGKVIHSNTIVAANFGYGPAPSFYRDFGPNFNLPKYLFTAGLESEYFLTRHIDKYPFSLSILGKYQYEIFALDMGSESEHHFDVKMVGYYPFRYNKVSFSPYASYGISDYSGARFLNTRAIGGMIGLHFSESDYCYLLIYNQRYNNGTGDHRTFVSLGLLW